MQAPQPLTYGLVQGCWQGKNAKMHSSTNSVPAAN